MGKIFGISDLPVAKPFPSLDFGKTEIITEGRLPQPIQAKLSKIQQDVFAPKISSKKAGTFISKFFHSKHTI